MSAPGSDALTWAARPRSAGVQRAADARGFTLIELMVVVALIAIASAVASLSLRDPSSTQLEREGARLAALLEAARVEARAAGIAVSWVPGSAEKPGFRFVGLPATLSLPTQWLDDGVRAEVRGEQGPARAALLGPEPVIGQQRIVLQLASQRLTLATDGLGPFTRVDDDASSP